jgi:GntR family transcriptional regulator
MTRQEGEQPTHTYQQLRASLRSGTFTVHDRLVENDLVDSFAATRHGIRYALQLLAEDGLVQREPRSGTSVVSAITGFSAGALRPSEDDARDRTLHAEPLGHRVTATPPLLGARLGFDDAEVLVVDQRGTLGGVPLYVRTGWTPRPADPEAFLATLTELDETRVPLPEAFLRLYGVPYGGSRADVQAMPADAGVAELLGIDEGWPVLLRELVLTDVDGRPREVSYTSFRGSHVSVTTNASLRTP